MRIEGEVKNMRLKKGDIIVAEVNAEQFNPTMLQPLEDNLRTWFTQRGFDNEIIVLAGIHISTMTEDELARKEGRG